jgi:hypothetical protein
LWVDQSRSGQLGDNTFAGENPPYVQPVNFQQRDRAHLVDTPLITFYLGAGATGMATLEITNPDRFARTLSIPAKPGITRYAWNVRGDVAADVFAGEEGGGRGAGAARGGAGGAGGGRGGAGGAGGGRGGAGGAGGARGAGGGRGRGAGAGRGGGLPPATPGTYTLRLTLGGSTSTGTLVVRADPLLR